MKRPIGPYHITRQLWETRSFIIMSTHDPDNIKHRILSLLRSAGSIVPVPGFTFLFKDTFGESLELAEDDPVFGCAVSLLTDGEVIVEKIEGTPFFKLPEATPSSSPEPDNHNETSLPFISDNLGDDLSLDLDAFVCPTDTSYQAEKTPPLPPPPSGPELDPLPVKSNGPDKDKSDDPLVIRVETRRDQTPVGSHSSAPREKVKWRELWEVDPSVSLAPAGDAVANERGNGGGSEDCAEKLTTITKGQRVLLDILVGAEEVICVRNSRRSRERKEKQRMGYG
ncbi:hypothetical protein BC938DRAFT_480138 [Jimgerdemannia flammicorona]|uniref:Uncharacterized protein n=1 Tax=Jimgerdemannia flammicorona TaxID=994334 RepID=A0A433QJA9_9FUNG|nr:hypothetical protein BC938DRAFT_480138 [Jimgerdemannia flammicorona]